MDDSEIYVNMKFKEADSPSPSQAAHGLEPKGNIGRRPCRLICLVCLVTSLIVTVAGVPIYVLQIRQSNITSDRNCHEINSTLQSKLYALNSDLSDLRHQFCELLTSRREQTCSKDWVTNKDRCYFVSMLETSLYKAIQECSIRDSRLLEINSRDEASFVSRNLAHRNLAYWIGKCESRNVSFRLLYKVSFETSVCHQCDPTAARKIYPCDRDHRFICEKPAPLIPDIPEKIRALCQQPVEAT